jgi:hypothetical protein
MRGYWKIWAVLLAIAGFSQAVTTVALYHGQSRQEALAVPFQ